ncbi:MAG: hypothetical protein LBV69_04535 [Bacteroidales bacterium]|jgi:hypothetical protein|nr:hypothetical protein [Bacteroidales bacterium]
MKNFSVILIFFFTTNLYSQKNMDFLESMIGTWNYSENESKGLEIWTKTKPNEIIIENYKILDFDTILFNTKIINISENEISLTLQGLSPEQNSSEKYKLTQIDENLYSFCNSKSKDVIALNYFLFSENKIHFWLESTDNDFFCIDYILKKNE